MHVLSAIAVFAISAGILLAAQSGCIGATLAGTDGSYDTPDTGLFERHTSVQTATEEWQIPDLTAACRIVDTLADTLFTGVLDTAYAAHGILSLTPLGNIEHNVFYDLHELTNIAIFNIRGHTYAAVTAPGNSAVQILNITNPSRITATDKIRDGGDLALSNVRSIAIFESGGHTYAAVAASGEAAVQILNITDPSNITAAGNIRDGGSMVLGGAYDIAIFESGGHTYAAVAAFFDNGVQILNITNPSNITAAGSITDPNPNDDGRLFHSAESIATFKLGSHIYAAVTASITDSVEILNITNPSDITTVGRIKDFDPAESRTLNGAQSIATFKLDNHTYAAVTAPFEDGVQILNITNPSDITTAGSIRDSGLVGAHDITTFKSGGHTYAAVTAYDIDNVQILDITDPSHITAVSSIRDMGNLELKGPTGIVTFESGGHTYAAVAATDDNGVQIIRIDVTANPAASVITVGEGDTVVLSGPAIDPNADSITYTWSQTSPDSPLIAFANISAPSTTFIAPAVTEDTAFTLVLTAHDGTQPVTDTRQVTVKETSTAFITTWAVSDSDKSITLPMKGMYSILWGDGSYSPNVSGSQSHTYSTAGTYTVAVLGKGLESITLLDYSPNSRQLRSIEQWGDTEWTTMHNAFGSASNMVYHATDAPDLSKVNNTSNMFSSSASFDGNLTGWDVSSVTSMDGMFATASAFNGDLSGWDVSSVTDMNGMFWEASSFKGDLSGWDVSSVTDMNSMFYSASSFDGDLSGWNVSLVNNTNGMFSGASSFDGDLSGWNVSSVTYMNHMFRDASSFNGNLSGWNVSSVTHMSNMFNNAVDFNQPLNSWDVSSVIDMTGMFEDASSFNGNLSGWNVSSVTHMAEMFSRAYDFDQNLGTWYIVPAGTDFDAGGSSLNVTTVFAQNSYLRGQNPVYGIVSDGNSDLFEMRGSTLAFNESPYVGHYQARVTASGGVFEDGNNWRVLDITVQSSIDRPPSVQAGDDQTVGEGDTVTLSGSVADPDGNQITSMWSQTSPDSPTIRFVDASAPSTTFKAPAVTEDTTFTFVLTADDNTHRATDMLNITVRETGVAFITTWTVSDSDMDITLPMRGMYSVLWGDASYDANVSGSQSHSYDTAGTYTVTVLDNGLQSINLSGDTSNALHLESIEQWGGTKWITMSGAFAGASSMAYNTTDVPDLSKVTDMSDMFRNAKNSDGDLSGWNVSSVTHMNGTFSGASSFNQTLNSWNVSSVIDMNNMFSGARAFDSDISGWNVSSVIDMNNMFSGARAFDSDISGWNVSSVIDMNNMFSGARAFDSDISGWNVSSVTDMNSMFKDAAAFNQPLNNWNVSSVTDMNSMFRGARAFDSDISGWNVSSVIDMNSMFRGARAFDSDISGWNVSSVIDMNSMFRGARAFDSDISGWNVSSVIDMNSMFSGARAFDSDISGWNVASVTDMNSMFFNANSFNGNLSGWNVSSVTDMKSMFFGTASFNRPLNSWNVSSVDDMSYMFRDASVFNQPLGDWNVSSVDDMTDMFSGASLFNQNLGNWYVVPDSMSIDRTDVPNVVGSISAQNADLNRHNPEYNIGTGGNSTQFEIVNYNQLNMTSVDTKSAYTVNVTASGGSVFENGNNWHLLEIEVTDQTTDTTPPSISGAVAASLNSVTVRFSENVNADATDGSHWSLGRTDAGFLTVSANTNPAGSSNSMTLTLSGDLPDTGPDLSLIYIKPTTGGITDGTNQLEGATVTVEDGIAPTVLSVEAVTSRSIAVRMSEPVTSGTAGPGGFSLTTGGTAPAVSSISVSGETVTLTLSGPLPAGAVTLNYDSTSGNVADVSDNTLADFLSVAVDTSADTTPPAIDRAVAASLNSITVRFSENVNADATDGSHWSLGRTDAGSLTVSANTNPAGSSNSMTLTLSGDLPDTGPDLSLIYIKPTTGGITDGTNQLEGATVTVEDGIAPTVLSVEAVTSRSIAVRMSEPVTSGTAGPGGFSLTTGGTAPAVSSISVSGETVTLTLSGPLPAGAVTLNYDSTSGNVADVSDNTLADFLSVAVDTSADTTPPAIDRAVAASLNSITVRFSENVNADATDGSHWSLGRTDAGSLTVSANTNPAGSSNSMTLTLSGDLPDTGPDLSLIYIKPTTGGITDGTNQLEGATVTVEDGIAPTVLSVEAVTSRSIAVRMSEPVTSGTAGPGGFSLTTGGTAPAVSSISVSGETVTLTLSGPLPAGAVTLNYDSTSGNVADVSDNTLADFSSVAVDTSADTTPPAIDRAVAASLNSVTVRFSENVNADATDGSHWSLGRTDAGSLTVSANTNPAGSSNSMTLTLSGDLPDTGPDLSLIYIKPTTGGITDGNNQLEGATVTVEDGIAPTVLSVEAVTSRSIAVRMSEPVTSGTAGPGGFSLTTGGTAPAVSSISVSGETVTLTLSGPLPAGTISLSYDSTSGNVADVSDNTLADFLSVAVDTSADTTPPAIDRAVAASLNSVTVRFSENVNADATDGSHWSLGRTDAGSLTVSANTDPTGSSNSMTLTLSGDLPDTRPDLSLIYIKPTTGGITDGTNQLEGETVTVEDGIAPTVLSVEAVTSRSIAVRMSEPVTSGTAGPGGFSLTTGGTAPAVSSISVSGETVTLTLSGPLPAGTISLSYDSTSGNVADVSDNTLADFSSVAVDTSADTTPPAIDRAVAASLNSVTVRFSENVNADATDGSHWSLGRTDAGSLTVSANTNPAGSSNSMTLTLSGDLPDTRPDLSLIYIKPTTGGITDGTNQLEGETVTVEDGIAPTVLSVEAVTSRSIAVRMSEPVTSGTAGPGGFSLTTGGTAPAVSSISVSGETVTLTLSGPLPAGTISLSYDSTSGNVADVSDNTLADFSSVAVDTSADTTPPAIDRAVAASLNSVTVRFSENVNADATDGSHWSLGRTDAGSLTVSANTNPAGELELHDPDALR